MNDYGISYEALQNAANQVRQHKDNFDTMISGMTTIVDGLSGQWEGVAKTEFENAFRTLKPTLQKFSALMQRYSEELDKEVAETQQSQSGRRQSVQRNLTLD